MSAETDEAVEVIVGGSDTEPVMEEEATDGDMTEEQQLPVRPVTADDEQEHDEHKKEEVELSCWGDVSPTERRKERPEASGQPRCLGLCLTTKDKVLKEVQAMEKKREGSAISLPASHVMESERELPAMEKKKKGSAISLPASHGSRTLGLPAQQPLRLGRAERAANSGGIVGAGWLHRQGEVVLDGPNLVSENEGEMWDKSGSVKGQRCGRDGAELGYGSDELTGLEENPAAFAIKDRPSPWRQIGLRMGWPLKEMDLNKFEGLDELVLKDVFLNQATCLDSLSV